jgi:hypothetical protein
MGRLRRWKKIKTAIEPAWGTAAMSGGTTVMSGGTTAMSGGTTAMSGGPCRYHGTGANGRRGRAGSRSRKIPEGFLPLRELFSAV